MLAFNEIYLVRLIPISQSIYVLASPSLCKFLYLELSSRLFMAFLMVSSVCSGSHNLFIFLSVFMALIIISTIICPSLSASPAFTISSTSLLLIRLFNILYCFFIPKSFFKSNSNFSGKNGSLTSLHFLFSPTYPSTSLNLNKCPKVQETIYFSFSIYPSLLTLTFNALAILRARLGFSAIINFFIYLPPYFYLSKSLSSVFQKLLEKLCFWFSLTFLSFSVFKYSLFFIPSFNISIFQSSP